VSPQLEAYLRLSDELDALWGAGLGDSPEADELRDRMAGPWYALTAADHEELRKALAERTKAREASP
jgi:hypothetical protein